MSSLQDAHLVGGLPQGRECASGYGHRGGDGHDEQGVWVHGCGKCARIDRALFPARARGMLRHRMAPMGHQRP